MKIYHAERWDLSEMKFLIAFFCFVTAFTACLAPSFAQGIGEYGRVLGGIGTKAGGPGKSMGSERIRPESGKPESRVGEVPAGKLPSVLIVAVSNAWIYSRSEDWSDKISDIAMGERVVPMLESGGSNPIWYMIKTQSGVMGWMKASDVTPNTSRHQR